MSKIRILVEMSGGLIQAITSDRANEANRLVQIDLIDYDDGDEAACVTQEIDQGYHLPGSGA